MNELSCNADILYDSDIEFYGWIRRIRIGGGGSIIFIDIYDGTDVGSLKCMALRDSYSEDGNGGKYTYLYFEQLTDSKYLSCGCSVVVAGKLCKSPANTTQKFEHHIYNLSIIGGVQDYETYPIQKSNEKHLLRLRKLPFDRVKAQLVQCLFRIRSNLLFAIHSFFHDRNVICTDPNILHRPEFKMRQKVSKKF